MPRQVRIEFPGATYHVMCRGDRQEWIFADDDDRKMFLFTLVEAIGRTGWLLHAYVLMGNHYHFVLETPESNLVRGMPGARPPTPPAITRGTERSATS